jgi:hypothetical protein
VAKRFHYRVRRIIATAVGVGLLTLSGWFSWNHFHDVTAPIAVFVGAGMFHFAETSWFERFRLRAVLFGGLALLAAFISLTGVVSRVGSVVDARLQQRQSENLPRHQAQLALGEAEEELKTAEAAAGSECSSGHGPRCKGLEDREAAARQRVADARAKLAGLGARTVEDPLARRLAAIIPGVSEANVQLYLPLLLPTWLELSGLVLVSFGLAPPRRKVRIKARKRRVKQKRAPRHKPVARLGNVVRFPRKA